VVKIASHGKMLPVRSPCRCSATTCRRCEAATGTRSGSRAKRVADREAAKKKKLEEKPKGGGGGGSGKQPKGPSAQDKLDQQLATLARLVGKTYDPSSFTVFKDAKGQWRWLSQTSNGFEDRDKEIVSTKALAADVARADKDKLYGPLRWWHIGDPDPLNPTEPWGPGFDLGMCDFNAMSGGVLVESGTFKSEAIAEWASAKAGELGLSPGFFHPENQPDENGVFDNIRRFERSLAPENRVSNLFTAFMTAKGQRPMESTKIKELLDMGLAPAVVKELMDGAAMTEKTAQQQGVRFKAQNPVLAQLEALGEQIVALKASMIEEDVKAPPAGMVEGSPEEEAGETQEQEDAEGDLLDMTKQDLKDLIAEVVAPLAAAITSLSKGVDVSSKVEGMLKSLGEEVKTMTGATATKTQKDTEATQQESRPSQDARSQSLRAGQRHYRLAIVPAPMVALSLRRQPRCTRVRSPSRSRRSLQTMAWVIEGRCCKREWSSRSVVCKQDRPLVARGG
jgi:hypothetical protein